MAYATPIGVYGVGDRVGEGNFIELVQGKANVIKAVWYSDYKTFNVQYKARKRLKPSQQASMFDPHEWNAEWEDIDWTGSDTALVTPSKSGTRCEHQLGTFPFDISTYDYMELMVRVRVKDSQDRDQPSEWCYGIVKVLMVPSHTLAAVRNDDGSVTFSVAMAGWQRDGNVAHVSWIRAGGPVGRVLFKATREPFECEGAGTAMFTVPAEYVGADTLYLRCNVQTCDGGAVIVDQTVTVSIRPGKQQTIDPAPSIQLDDLALITFVNDGQHDYDSVLFSFSWEDALGRAYSETIEGTYDGYNWNATLDDPPFGVYVTIRAVAENASGWGSAEGAYRLRDGSNVLTAPGEEPIRIDAAVGEMQAVNRAIKQDVEMVRLDGRSMPVARYGARRTPTITANAVIGEGHMSLADAERLTNPHDWTLRTYDGMRCRVAIESVSTAHVAKDWRSVQISMSEVG